MPAKGEGPQSLEQVGDRVPGGDGVEPAAELAALRWVDHAVDDGADGTCRVTVRADSIDWLVNAVTRLAMAGDVAVQSPPEVVAAVERLSRHLSGSMAAATPSGEVRR